MEEGRSHKGLKSAVIDRVVTVPCYGFCLVLVTAVNLYCSGRVKICQVWQLNAKGRMGVDK